MSVREGLEFESEISSDTNNLNHTVISLIEKFKKDVHFLTDPTRGGVATVLNELCQSCHFGIELFQSTIPIDEQVASACELLGLDPLYVANEGLFLSVVPHKIADQYVEALQEDNNGKYASIIGTVVKQHPKQVILKSKIGGTRIVSMLPGEQLPRIC